MRSSMAASCPSRAACSGRFAAPGERDGLKTLADSREASARRQRAAEQSHGWRASRADPAASASLIDERVSVLLRASATFVEPPPFTMPRYKRTAEMAELDLPATPEVAPEQAATLHRLRNMWEFASFMQYVFLFGHIVKIDDDFDIEVRLPRRGT